MSFILIVVLILISSVIINLLVVIGMHNMRMLNGTFDELIYILVPIPLIGTLIIFSELIRNIKHNRRPDVIAYNKYLKEFYRKQTKKK